LRTGIEITNNYNPAPWVRIDADLALSRARFIGFDSAQEQLFESLAGFPQAQIGNAPGNFVPEAPWMVASAGITFGEKTGWFSALRWRYISSRPLTEDGLFQSPPLNTINADVGYRFANGWRIQLDALNLLNSECLRKALRAAPDYADAMFNLALLLQRKNQYPEAADYWRRYLASDSRSDWATRARRSLKFCEMQSHLSASA
jgi:tetratricopeptide (TPR) repeat protein